MGFVVLDTTAHVGARRRTPLSTANHEGNGMRIGKLLVVAVVCVTFAAESAQGFQGSEVSVASFISSVTPPASCVTPATVVSVATPQQYRSSRDYLLITTSIEGHCPTGQIFAHVSVAGTTVQPTAFAIQCDGSLTTRTTTSLWFLVPASEGGPVIPAGSVVDVGVCANTEDSTVTSAQLRVETRR
jgi:hypothetical protein